MLIARSLPPQVQALHRVVARVARTMAANRLPYTLGFQPATPAALAAVQRHAHSHAASSHAANGLAASGHAAHAAAAGHSSRDGAGASGNASGGASADTHGTEHPHAAASFHANHYDDHAAAGAAGAVYPIDALPSSTAPTHVAADALPPVAVELFPCRFFTDLQPKHVEALLLTPHARASADAIGVSLTDSLLRLGGACLRVGAFCGRPLLACRGLFAA